MFSTRSDDLRWRSVALPLGGLAAICLIGAAMASAVASGAGPTDCPQRLNSAPKMKGPAGGRVVKVAGLRAARVCRYSGEPVGGAQEGERHGGQLAGSRWLGTSMDVKNLGGFINHLEPWSKADVEAVRSCGEDNGSGAYIIFRYQDGSRASITAHFSGCPSVTNGRRLYMLSGSLKKEIEQLVPLES